MGDILEPATRHVGHQHVYGVAPDVNRCQTHFIATLESGGG
jgi:hypothetical protein